MDGLLAVANLVVSTVVTLLLDRLLMREWLVPRLVIIVWPRLRLAMVRLVWAVLRVSGSLMHFKLTMIRLCATRYFLLDYLC